MTQRESHTDGPPRPIHARRLEQATGKLTGLKPEQQQAIGLILSGCALVDIAKRLGVTRGAVYHWTHRNEKFVAALESWRTDMEQAARARLLGLSGLAFKAIHKALEAGDAKLALALFKGLGVLERRGEPTPEVNRVIFRRAVAR